MSDSSPLDLLVKLFIASETQVRSWTTSFIAANGALLAGLGALIAWGNPAEEDLQLLDAVLTATCVLGVSCSVVLGSAIFRQQRWRSQCLARIRSLQDPQHPLVAHNGGFSGAAVTGTLTLAMTALMCIAWISLLVVLPHLEAIVENRVQA